ncbi:signal transduction histidine kinase [Caulobacter rhizosphaerae]|uniref:histidine kinase n=1 Tax=Caulobacter rhizosphaerae TaxID=2010972 RepID=A0ABU1N1M4_9CAUL|nr:HAMP domain-containing sensor histidine kinase [Caulobacter rhizosphaerae]MDR6532005.1 signal transduction histidine kinase [Caulobacter rhizosphaerae]
MTAWGRLAGRVFPRRWPSPPIAVQVMALLLTGLVAAQTVTLGLTVLLPPAPPMHHSLADIAAGLRGAVPDDDADRPLVRTVETQPPSLQSPGWVASEAARADLARLLDAPRDDVRLLFYAPPPFAGAESRRPGRSPLALLLTTYAEAQTLPPGLGPGGIGGPGDGMGPIGPGMGGVQIRQGFPSDGGMRAATGQRVFQAGDPGGQRIFSYSSSAAAAGRSADPLFAAPFRSRATTTLPDSLRGPAPPAPPLDPVADAVAREPTLKRPPPPQPLTATAPVVEPVQAAPHVALPAPSPPPAKPQPEPEATIGRPLAAPATRSLFGLAPPPFIEGDFVAALRVGPNQWATLRPRPEAFPNSWQRRVLMWFALSLAVVAPLGWIFARRLAAPLAGFAAAAEQLGRDPASPVIVADGPAEIGRAARAFNAMQGRLSRYITDRTAMIGAISHDLRTPLARLRFRLERASPSLRREIGQDLDQMEAMITSVLAFMREDAEAGARQRVDLRSLLECVIDEAEVTGGDVALEPGEPAEVEVSVLGLQRVFANLLDNAVKYGDSARVALHVEGDETVVEIRDSGPGLEPEDLERVFTPFYRGVEARGSSKQGVGLGLSSARSIIRAHGGDIRLSLPGEGLLVQVRLPLVGTAEVRPPARLQAAE